MSVKYLKKKSNVKVLFIAIWSLVCDIADTDPEKKPFYKLFVTEEITGENSSETMTSCFRRFLNGKYTVDLHFRAC